MEFGFFRCNSRYKLEVLPCVVDMCIAKYFNFLNFTCLSVVQNETDIRVYFISNF